MKELIKKFIPGFLLDLYHFSLAFLGGFFYGFPSKRIAVIGITGTSGKSTTVELTVRTLEQAGHKTAFLSSAKFYIAGRQWENKLKMTMPGRFKIQRFLQKAVQAGCQYVVIETTSEGIKQFRHKFIDFKVAVLTNLSPEHIESHHGFENYRKTKLKLFQAAKNIHIINLDDESAGYFLQAPAKEKYGYGIKVSNFPASPAGGQAVFAEDIQQTAEGTSFRINSVNFNLKIPGQFNVYNALAAICVGLSQEISLEICQKALQEIKGIPGRMEFIARKPFSVVVDYAHTPQSLIKVYETLRDSKFQIPNSKLICVLGACGGGRDKWKRPVMGKIAAQYCDKIIITNEDPYDEDPMEIIGQVVGDTRAEKILDRKEAIRKSIESVKPGDVVIITGKGSEPWMCVKGGKKIPWSDKQIVLDFLNRQSKINL